jgi:hypothetical protein
LGFVDRFVGEATKAPSKRTLQAEFTGRFCARAKSWSAEERIAMELILIIILLILLFGGGFGYYRGGYHTRGGPYGIGGILAAVLIVY